MTTARIVEKSVTVNNSSIQDYTHLGDHILPTYEMIPGFKRFTDKTKLRVLMFRAMHSVVEGYFPIRPLNQIIFINCHVHCIFQNFLDKRTGNVRPTCCFMF